MRKPPYAGPDDTNQFDDLTPDEALRAFTSYRLLGDCFEESSDDELVGRGWLIEDWRALLKDRQQQAYRAERELSAAVRLARNEGVSWHDIGRTLRLPLEEVRARFDWPYSDY
jgi:hypothetical protein